MSRFSEDSELGWFLRRNLAVMLFIVIASAGLFVLYRNFTSTEERPYTVQVGGEAAIPAGLTLEDGGTGYTGVEYSDVSQKFAQSPGPLKIAIVAGHRGSDSGAVCEDGLQELEINEGVADRVQRKLEAENLPVSILGEFDNRLSGFSSDVLISLHADSCAPLDASFTGYKTTVNASPQAALLQSCIEENYARATGLPKHTATITDDMVHYHAFNKISAASPALLLEMGFMYNDRQRITEGADGVAQGITDGILCFLQSR